MEKVDGENTSYKDFCSLVRGEIQTMREQAKPKKRNYSEHQTRIFTNTIEKTVEMLVREGAQITTKKEENEGYTAIIIKIKHSQ